MRLPSSFSITLGSRPSMMATTEFVVPRSMPMVFFTCFLSPRRARNPSRLLPRCGGYSKYVEGRVNGWGADVRAETGRPDRRALRAHRAARAGRHGRGLAGRGG